MPPILPEPFRVTPGYSPGYADRTSKPLIKKAKRVRRNRVTDVTVFRIPYSSVPATSPGGPLSIGVLSLGGYTVTHPLIYISNPLIYIYKQHVTVAVTARNPGYVAPEAGYASMPAPGLGASASDAPASPCVGTCGLDDAGLCRGCGRTAGEIAGWPGLDDAGKRDVLDRIAGRGAGAAGGAR